MVETVVMLKPRSEWRPGMTTEQLKTELNNVVKLPGVANAWVMPIKTRIDMLATGIKTPVGVKIAGPDLKVIEEIGGRIEQVVKQAPGTASAFFERVTGGRYVNIDIDRVKAARLGLNVQDIQDVINTAIGGMNVTETVEGLERYPVNIRYPQSIRDSLDKLTLLPVVTPSGARIALGDVTEISIQDGPPMIKSENARLNGWIYIDTDERDLGSYVSELQARVREQVQLPPGYSVAWSGQYEYMVRAYERLWIVGPVTLMIIILLLYINFRSLPEVLIIIGTLPFALGGGAWLLYLMDYNLSVAVAVGFIALAGVAAETAVIMLVYLNLALNERLRKLKQSGDPLTLNDLREVVVEGALVRLRPKTMTVTVIIAGLLPIMLGTGTGSEVMRRIAAPMVGGMVSAAILTLIIIPAVFLIWKNLRLEQINKELFLTREVST
ncbi:MAG: Cu(I)/Ag(I) efflux system rane protein CusA, partial [Gammaproteobacteria bacterium]|nr:Cu(I)/Ag(I) efflux system rane protein CusA [Gammaproteobacteria bacterium]